MNLTKFSKLVQTFLTVYSGKLIKSLSLFNVNAIIDGGEIVRSLPRVISSVTYSHEFRRAYPAKKALRELSAVHRIAIARHHCSPRCNNNYF